ncbi:hypothetical protein SDRG_01250, partial [Saprolegnia diclina VS20]
MGSIFSTSSTPAAGTSLGSEWLHGDAASKDADCAESAGGATTDEGNADVNSDKTMQSLGGSEDASTAGRSDSLSTSRETASILLGHTNEALYEVLSDDDAVDSTTAMDHSKSYLGKRDAPSFERNGPAKRQRMVSSPSLSLPAPDDACSLPPFLQLDGPWSNPSANVQAPFALASPKAIADCPFA